MEGISTSQWLYLGVDFLSFYTSMDFSVFLLNSMAMLLSMHMFLITHVSKKLFRIILCSNFMSTVYSMKTVLIDNLSRILKVMYSQRLSR